MRAVPIPSRVLDRTGDLDEHFPEYTGAVSRGIQRAGTLVFWAALIVIVAARVAFFRPDLFAAFH